MPGEEQEPGFAEAMRQVCSLVLPASSLLQFSLVQLPSHVRLCGSMNRSTPGLPVHHRLLEFTQTRVH